jgi:hypothetical protein
LQRLVEARAGHKQESSSADEYQPAYEVAAGDRDLRRQSVAPRENIAL